jgi:DNA-binding MarR family transcriptional regulator
VTVSDLARPFPVSLPAIMKHLDVLSDAGLITRSKAGRTVTCQITPAPMEQAMNWLAHYERYWTEQLDRLAAFLEQDQWQPSPASSSSAESKPRRKKSTKRGPSRSS